MSARWLLFVVMDRACEWSGHRLRCYNEPRWINRLFAWADEWDQGEAA